MKKSMSIISSLLLSSTLFLGLSTAEADELVVKQAADVSTYCHMKFPPMREDTLSWPQPLFEENVGNIIDFYGPCDYDPTGAAEITRQKGQRSSHVDND
jgi:hypothetical protein